MKTLILLDNAACPSDVALFSDVSDAADVTVAVWDRGSVPDGQVSIPAELGRRLLPIRAELAAWTYETGCVRVRGQMLEEHLRAGDSLSMWWCSTLVEKHPKVTHNLFAALKLRALEQLIEELEIVHIIVVKPEGTDGWMSDVLGRFCKDTRRLFTERVAVEALRMKEKPSGLKERLMARYHALPAPLKALLRFPAWLWTTRRRLPRTIHPRPKLESDQKPASIVTYFPNIDMIAAKEGRFRSRYWESLHDALKPAGGKGHRVNWVFLYFPAPQCSFRQAMRLRERFREKGEDGASFHFIEEFLTAGDIWGSLARYMRLFASSRGIESEVRGLFRFSGSNMDLWPLLKANWADSTRGWRALERCLMRTAFRRYAQWAGPQEWTIFPQENCPWERMLAQSMHEAEAGPVYGAQHSTVRPTDFRYFDDPRMINDPACRKAMPELWLCNGTGARDALLAADMPQERAGLVEALRYLYLAPSPEKAASKETASKEAASKEAALEEMATEEMATEEMTIDETPPRRLLIVTSFFADETDAHLNTLAAASRAGALADWDVIVKPHPYLPVAQRLQKLFAGSSCPAPQIVDGAIGTFLTPGTVVWASNSTTVALEAAFCGLPVLVQAAEDDVDLCPLQGLPNVAIVRTTEDVAMALAHPKAPDLPPEYLALDPALPRWRNILGLEQGDLSRTE